MTEADFFNKLFSSCPSVHSLEFRLGVGSDLERYKINDIFLPSYFFYGSEDDEFKSWLIEADIDLTEAQEVKRIVQQWNRSYKKDYVVPFRHYRTRNTNPTK